MASPIVGTELKVRGFETDELQQLASDHRITLDGLTSGPGNASVPITVDFGLRGLLPGVDDVSGLENPRVPVVSGGLNQPLRSANYPIAALASGGGGMYLGPKSSPPVADNFGNPLEVGHTYYNISNDTFYIFSSAGRFVVAAAALPASIRAYYYSISIETSVIPPNGPGTADSYGNILEFDVSTGQVSVNGINVYLNGVLQVNGADYTVNEGGAGGDFIALATPMCVNTAVVVQLFTVGDVQFSPNAVAIDTSAWLFDDIQTDFELFNMSGVNVFPGTPTNVLVSQNNIILQPAVDFLINGDVIQFTTPPEFGSSIWVVVGLPTQGSQGVAVNRVSPFTYGAVGDGIADDTLALSQAITQVNQAGGVLDLARGTWRVTAALPILNKPIIDGGGTGEIYVDYDPEGFAVLDCRVEVPEIYNVVSVTTGIFDFSGTFSSDTPVTVITIALTAGQLPPVVGDVGKITATDQIVESDLGDFVGQHVYIAAMAAHATPGQWLLYIPAMLVDSYTTSIQLHMLDKTQRVLITDFGVRGNWARLVAEDWRGIGVRVVSAVEPRVFGLWFRDWLQGLALIGTYLAATYSIRAHHLRNATASETPAIVGYGVVDGGSYMTVHTDLGGDDCRHVYTTIAPNSSNPRVQWGRAFRPTVNGGASGSCSSSAYDTHSDAYEARFMNLDVDGGYFSESSTGSGFQFRGVRCRATNCHVRRVPVGFVFYKQFANDFGEHFLDGCSYEGSGIGVKFGREDVLTPAEARQTNRVRNFDAVVTGDRALDVEDGVLQVEGAVRVIQKGSQDRPRAIFLRAAAEVNTTGNGILIYDFSGMTATINPRLMTFTGPNCGSRSKMQIIAGDYDWQSWVSDNDDPASPANADAFVIEGDADRAPQNPSGGFAEFGTNSRLPSGSLKLRSTLNGGRAPATRSANFTLANINHAQRIVCTAAITVTVPVVDIIGYDFECTIVATGGTVTIDGPAGSNPTVPTNSCAIIAVANARIYVQVVTLTDVT